MLGHEAYTRTLLLSTQSACNTSLSGATHTEKSKRYQTESERRVIDGEEDKNFCTSCHPAGNAWIEPWIGGWSEEQGNTNPVPVTGIAVGIKMVVVTESVDFPRGERTYTLSIWSRPEPDSCEFKLFLSMSSSSVLEVVVVVF